MTFADTLALAVRNVVKGCPFFGPSPGKKGPTKPPGRHGKLEAKGTSLTPRESDVLRLRAGGAGNSQVAAKLCISVEAVERHLMNLMAKLKISRADDLVQFAVPV
jgi:DNA-binding NarL/FixJ family response regulator